MLEITNQTRFNVPLMIKSKKRNRRLVTLFVPAIGEGNNVVFLEDERATEYIDRAEKEQLIKVKKV